MSSKRKAILLVNIWQHTGGLEAVNRDVAVTFQNKNWKVKVISVFGTNDDNAKSCFDVLSLCPKNRYLASIWHRFLWKFVIAMYIRYTLSKGGLLIFGHAHLLPLLNYLPQKSSFKRWTWIYGIDTWGSEAIRWMPYLNRVDRVISISSFTAEQVIGNGLKTPIDVVPCCVDTEMFKPTNFPDKIRRNEVLICGRMAASESYKGHTTLFESIPIAEKLLGQTINIRVIGSGDDQPRLESISKKLNLSKQIIFSGRVSNSELVDAYQHCGLFCMPSIVIHREKGYWTGEGFGIVYVEAASCGRPVLASSDGGAPETIISGKTGLLVDPRSPDDIARAIAEIMSDPVRADEMGRQGRLLAIKKFSKEQFDQNVYALVKRDEL